MGVTWGDSSNRNIAHRRPNIMKLKLIALFLALALTSWAQTTTSTPEQKSAPAETKMACSCCDKMTSADQKTTDQKEAHACMHQSAAGKDDKTTMSCC